MGYLEKIAQFQDKAKKQYIGKNTLISRDIESIEELNRFKEEYEKVCSQRESLVT